MKVMNCVAYACCAKAQPVSHSLINQYKQVERYCEWNALKLVETYVEFHVDTGNPDLLALQHIMEKQMDERPFDLLITTEYAINGVDPSKAERIEQMLEALDMPIIVL